MDESDLCYLLQLALTKSISSIHSICNWSIHIDQFASESSRVRSTHIFIWCLITSGVGSYLIVSDLCCMYNPVRQWLRVFCFYHICSILSSVQSCWSEQGTCELNWTKQGRQEKKNVAALVECMLFVLMVNCDQWSLWWHRFFKLVKLTEQTHSIFACMVHFNSKFTYAKTTFFHIA
jgi:hypothetical protein